MTLAATTVCQCGQRVWEREGRVSNFDAGGGGAINAPHSCPESTRAAEDGHRPLPPMRPASSGEPQLVRLSSVAPESVEWLWKDRIALGKVSLIDGDPGELKSTIALDIGARITTGRPMPDGTPGLDGGVVLLTFEDGLADTIRPRLDAAGADVDRVVALQGVGGGDDERLPAIPQDMDAIRAAIAEVGAKLVIIDPLMAALGGDVNSHRDQDVRRALAPLARLAEDMGVAILVIRHLNKGQGQKAVYRGGGSIGIGGAARAVFLAAADPDSEGEHVLAAVKTNLAAPPPAMRYRPVQAENGAVSVEWLGTSEHTASQLLATTVESEEETGALADAKRFLVELLADGPMLAAEIESARKRSGVGSDRTLRRARIALGVVTQAVYEDGRRGAKAWRWALPGRLDDHVSSVDTYSDSDRNSPIPAGRLNGAGQLDGTRPPATPAPAPTSARPCADCRTPTSDASGMCLSCQAREARFHGLGQPLTQPVGPAP